MKRFILCALALAGASSAWAADTTTTVTIHHDNTPGSVVMVGGGAEGFTKSEAADRTSTGGAWDVRATYGTRSILGGEIAYVGSALPLTNSDATLLSNGAEANLRVNAPIKVAGSDAVVVPFATAGVGDRVYTIDNKGSQQGFVDNDNVTSVPLGIGIGGDVQGVYVDTRLKWDPSWGAEANFGDTRSFDTLAWTANVGGSF